jgi:hypothetical protein
MVFLGRADRRAFALRSRSSEPRTIFKALLWLDFGQLLGR